MPTTLASAVSSTSSPTPDATASGTPNRFSELTSADFVKIMFTELTNQDPLKPNDSNTLLQQFSSLRGIEADLALENKLDSVVTQSQFATAGALLGKYITGYTDNLDPVEGIVKSVSQTKNGAVLNLANGSRVPFKNLSEILEPPSGHTPTTTPGTTTPPPAAVPASTALPLPGATNTAPTTPANQTSGAPTNNQELG